jgi:ATP-dependent protease ClpP protease subunit
MEAILKIYGDIGEPDKMMEMFGVADDTVSLKQVSEFLDNNKSATDITVRINSRGGDVQEGWAIYDLLSNSGKKIKTIGEGKIYSIATIVFLAGGEREMMKNADGLIHNPYIPPYTLADQYESGDLLKIAESLKQEEEKILDFYVEKTGSPKDKLAEYMKEDTKLSAEDMLSLGFATKIIEPVKAYAFIKPKNKFIMDEKEVKTFGEKLDTIISKIAGFSRLPAKDQTLKDKDGKEFKLEKESGAPAVGDKATPDGSFVMADGKTIVITNGVIAEIKEPVAAKTELELANEKITKLQAELDAEKVKVAAADKSKPDLIAAEASFKAKEAEAKALVTELTNLKNSWKPEGRVKFSSVEKVGDINLNKVRELMTNIKNKGE